MDLIEGEDGRPRCWWGASTPEYQAYHDTEWGFGVGDDHRLFEKLCLEGFQAGLSWLTILRKREHFREAFSGFDLQVVADFDEGDVARLLGDAGIVRHEAKIRSAVNNARRSLDVVAEHGSLAAFFWPHSDPGSEPPLELQSTTPASAQLAKDLKRKGFSFVGPTTVHAFMQAMGLVNDHLGGCWVRDEAERSRQAVRSAVLAT